jgi:hypothetical protein
MLSALLWFTLGSGVGFFICALLVSASKEEVEKHAWHAGYDYAMKREKEKNEH